MNQAFELLLPYLQDEPRANNQPRHLLVADENLFGATFATLGKTTEVMSNRFDIARAATAAGLIATFNDFDFSGYQPAHFARVCYRISKEKAVVEHIIAEAFSLLPGGGELILCGAKKEGIKRFASVAGECFSSVPDVHKHGFWYTARIIKTVTNDHVAPGRDESSYTHLIPVETGPGTVLYTKPGSFGAGKIDQGSIMLADYLPTFFQGFDAPPRSLLDLGCGYGYLTVCSARLGATRIVATDNCAAAINTCRANLDRLSIPAEVVADDCAEGITETFDAIICNPPFHQGFIADPGLTDKFLRSAANHLHAKSRALFVVNQFLALENTALRYFANVAVVAKTRSFKLVVMSQRRKGTS
tara:strand:+ start:15734 stop:16810 length:1077 start_codon:yes stop_codon:yes gene_type:complete